MNSSGREREGEREQHRESDRREISGQSLLQERLREKKAARLSERRQSVDTDMGAVSMSSPIRDGSGSIRQAREPADRPASSRGRVVSKQSLGIKGMEEASIFIVEL